MPSCFGLAVSRFGLRLVKKYETVKMTFADDSQGRALIGTFYCYQVMQTKVFTCALPRRRFIKAEQKRDIQERLVKDEI